MAPGHSDRRIGRGGALVSFVIRVAVSFGLLALLFAFVDTTELARRLAGADPARLAVVVVIVTADRLLMAWKWWLLIRGREAAVQPVGRRPRVLHRLVRRADSCR